MKQSQSESRENLRSFFSSLAAELEARNRIAKHLKRRDPESLIPKPEDAITPPKGSNGFTGRPLIFAEILPAINTAFSHLTHPDDKGDLADLLRDIIAPAMDIWLINPGNVNLITFQPKPDQKQEFGFDAILTAARLVDDKLIRHSKAFETYQRKFLQSVGAAQKTLLSTSTSSQSSSSAPIKQQSAPSQPPTNFAQIKNFLEFNEANGALSVCLKDAQQSSTARHSAQQFVDFLTNDSCNATLSAVDLSKTIISRHDINRLAALPQLKSLVLRECVVVDKYPEQTRYPSGGYLAIPSKSLELLDLTKSVIKPGDISQLDPTNKPFLPKNIVLEKVFFAAADGMSMAPFINSTCNALLLLVKATNVVSFSLAPGREPPPPAARTLEKKWEVVVQTAISEKQQATTLSENQPGNTTAAPTQTRLIPEQTKSGNNNSA